MSVLLGGSHVSVFLLTPHNELSWRSVWFLSFTMHLHLPWQKWWHWNKVCILLSVIQGKRTEDTGNNILLYAANYRLAWLLRNNGIIYFSVSWLAVFLNKSRWSLCFVLMALFLTASYSKSSAFAQGFFFFSFAAPWFSYSFNVLSISAKLFVYCKMILV